MPINKNYKDNFAYDIDKNVIKKAENKDFDTLNQSIEMILSTGYGERIFNPYFGCNLTTYLFQNINENTGEQLLDDVISAIKKWDDRIIVLENQCKLTIKMDENAIILFIPYIVRKNGLTSFFEKKIIL